MSHRPDPGPIDAARLISRACMVGVTVIFAYLLIYHYHHQIRISGWNLNDFPTFYLAAQCALQHRDIYTAGTSPQMMYVYPPLIAFLFTPLTLLSMRHAGQVALLLNTMMLFGSILLGTRAILRRLDVISPHIIWPVALLTSILSYNQMRIVLTMGETDPIMLLMFTLALCWLDSKPTLAGLALALALNIKYLSIVALPYLILRRRWKACIAMILGTVFFALLPAVLLGWHEDLRCLRVALGGLLRWVGVPPEVSHAIKVHDIADGLSISATSALGRLLGRYGFSNPAIMLAAAGVGLLVLGIVVWMYRVHRFAFWRWPDRSAQSGQPFRGLVALEWPGLVTAALVFSPDTNTRHLVIAVLVNTLAAVILLASRPGVRRTPALIGAVLIFLAFIMPFGRAWTAMGTFYYTCSIPGWGLLLGYLMILWTGLQERHLQFTH